MPNPIVTYIQTEPEWLHSGNGAANDAALLSCGEWWSIWGIGPEPASKEGLDHWWDRLEAQSDWQLCQRYGVGL